MSVTHRILVLVALAGSLTACSSSNSKDAVDNHATHDADNTARNAENQAEVTPLDQGGNELDMKITQTIRQNLMSDESMSTNAQNIKVISINGTVTLRGPVENPTELAQVIRIAEGVAGVTNVDSQLEVTQH